MFYRKLNKKLNRYNRYNCYAGGDNGFTLLELLIVLVIISTLLAVTYPKIRGFILYSGTNPGIVKTKNILNELLRVKYTALSGKTVYVKFNFKKNEIKVLYKKDYKLLPLKTIGNYLLKFKGVKIYGIKSGTSSCSLNKASKGFNFHKKISYIEISPEIPSYSRCIYFKDNNTGKKTALLLDAALGRTEII